MRLDGALARQAARRKLPRAARLRTSREIKRTVRRGRRHGAGPYVIHGTPATASGGSRLSVVVPRRVGTQAARNRIKRVFREAFRLERADWRSDWDVVVYVRSAPQRQLTLKEAQDLLRSAVAAFGRKPRQKSKDS